MVVEKSPMPAASPSSPSIRLKALLMLTNHRTVRGSAAQPSDVVAPSNGFEMASMRKPLS